MCFMLMQTADPSTLKDALPPLQSYTHVFLPVNDCTDPEAAGGGSHWTLLLVSLIDNKAFHYDSLNPSNFRPAKSAVYKLEQLLQRSLTLTDLTDTPQQENESDCGMFVCMNMDYLLNRLLSTEQAGNVDMDLRNAKYSAKLMRDKMATTIDDLRRKAIKSSSRSRSRTRDGPRSESPPRIGPGSGAS